MAEEENLPPSEEFWNAILTGGSIVADCELCGRTHFSDIGSLDWGEGELEDLLKKQQKNPDKYIIHSGDDSISNGYIDGMRVVYGCPCNRVSKYERLFWRNRDIIAAYLQEMADKKLNSAQRDCATARQVSDSVRELD